MTHRPSHPVHSFRSAENTINLPHDPLSPVNSRRNHRLCSRTRPVIEQVLCGLQMTGYQDSGHDCQHALAAFVHATTLAPFAFASPCELCYFLESELEMIPMTEDRYVVMTISCPHCKQEQDVHVRARTGASQVHPQDVRCLTCKKAFETMVPDRIIDGPFPRAS